MSRAGMWINVYVCINFLTICVFSAILFIEYIMSQNLTKKQEDILFFIVSYINHYGKSPTLAEICDKFKKATRTIVQHLNALQNKGFIYRDKNKHRNIVLLEKKDSIFDSMERIQVTSLIGCDDASTLGRDDADDYVLISKDIRKKYGEVKACRAVGLSMEKEGIMPGNILIIKPTADIENDIKEGDIIAARIENSVVAKKISFSDETITLLPMSDSQEYKPIVLSRNDSSLSIIGKVVANIPNMNKISNEEEIIYEREDNNI